MIYIIVKSIIQITKKMTKKRTLVEFINDANEKHNNKFDYSKVNYINIDTNIIIICPIHGEFIQTPYHHLNKKYGCKDCGNINSASHQPKNNDKFLDEIKKIHGDKFDYSKINYINTKTDVILICKKHNNEFSMKPNKILNGTLCCHDCITDNKKSIFSKPLSKFIEEAQKIHGDTYDYKKVNYTNSKTNIIIICSEHGEFSQSPTVHLRGNGCNKCSGKYKKTTDEFIIEARKIHGDKYDYTNVIYINALTNVIIYCKKHHKNYLQKP